MFFTLLGGALIGGLLSRIMGVTETDGCIALFGLGIFIAISLLYLGLRVATCLTYPDKNDWLYNFLKGLWTFAKNFSKKKSFLTREERVGGYLDFRYEKER